MTNRTAIKTVKSKLILILLVLLFVVMGLGFHYSPAKAGETITIDDTWSWQEFKTAIEQTYKNQTVYFSIDRTTPLLAESQITLTSDTDVTLICASSSHNIYTPDITRSKGYHGSFFYIKQGSILNVSCCLSGGAENTDGLLLYEYDSETKTSTRVTDAAELSTYVTKLGDTGYYYSPINYQYYGSALITTDGGTLNIDKDAVLKYNYNPYSTSNKNDYNGGIYSYNTREVVNKYYEKVDGRTFLMAYYNLPCTYHPETGEPIRTGGSAISNNDGIVNITDAQIYGCSSDDGPAILTESGDQESLTINSTKIYKNVARSTGGGIHFMSLLTNPLAPYQLTITDSHFFYNRANTSGGAIVTGYGATVKITGGSVYNNHAGTHGGGIMANSGPEKDIFDTAGGKTLLSGVKIYNNNAGGNGGGIGASATPSATNQLTINNCEIYNNSSSGTYTPTANTANTGYGGGIYSGQNCELVITNGSIIRNNNALGGVSKLNGNENPIGGRGAGLFVSGGLNKATIRDSIIKDNIASPFAYNQTEYTSAGGGIAVAGDLNIANTKINNNDARYGGGIYTGASSNVKVTGTSQIYENVAGTYGGGGIYNAGTLTVQDVTCYIYGNENYGIFSAANSTLNVHGGIFGAYNYNSYEDYVVSRNTVAQIGIAKTANAFIYSTNSPRIISEITQNENIDNNAGIQNTGTLTFKVQAETTNTIDFYGTGTSIRNAGTVTVEAPIRISTSKKDGLYTKQNRLGIYNNGTVNMGNADKNINKNTRTENSTIEYCNYRGIENYGTLNWHCGTINNCVAPYSKLMATTGSPLNGNGGGIYNEGNTAKLNVTGGTISNNIALRGAGVYLAENVKESLISNAVIKSNTSTAGGTGMGIYNLSTTGLTITDSNIGYNYAIANENSLEPLEKSALGGGVYNNGTMEINGTTKIHNNNVSNAGGGIYNNTNGVLEITSGEISENNAATDNKGSGGGIYNQGSLKIDGKEILIHNNNTGNAGGGIYNTGKSGTIEAIGCKIHENTALNGAGAYLVTNATFKEVDVYNNSSTNMGGGIGLTTTFQNIAVNIVDCNIYGNTSVNEGGGIHGGVPDGSFTVSGGEIYKNSSSVGGGIYVGGNTKLDSVHIYENSATDGAGIRLRQGTFEMNNCEVNDNVATSAGGGIYIYKSDSEPVNINDSIIHNNEGKNGGGISVSKTNGAPTTINGTSVYKNTAVTSGGIIHSSGEMLITGSSEIYENEATTYAGGIRVNASAILTIGEGVKIHNNTAKTLGGGIYINANAVVNMPDGIVSSNKADGNGDGVYLKNDGTFNMSELALVEEDNDVYLEKDAFITVPTDFTNDKNIRAYISGANMVTGRVVAKYGDNIEAEGTKALYHNIETKKENEQYFVVKNKLLRAGDQGAADNAEDINNQDIFITEKYTISFDMNPEGTNADAITHTIEGTQYIFDDLENTQAHTPYHKYWYEEITFNVGKALTSNGQSTEDWNTEITGTGESFQNDEAVTLPAEINKNYILYAQWKVSLEIDYNGNGATKGENFTDTDFSMEDTAYTLNSGLTAQGEPVFERLEIDEETGERKLFSLTGWSFNKNDKVYRYKQSEKVATNTLRTNAVIIDGRLNLVTTIYAIWDQYPTIQAVDRWFTLDEAQNGKITLVELLSSARATDGEVGNQTDFYDKDDETGELVLTDKEEFTIIDFNEEDFKAFTTSGSTTVTYKVVDAYGNEAYKTVVVHIVDDEEQKQDETTLYTRFISPKYYKNAEGEFIEPHYGGLNESSKWRTEAEYSNLLTTTLSNTKNRITKEWDIVVETWNWDIDEIKLCKKYITTYGLGNTENPDALTDFYNQFGPEN